MPNIKNPHINNVPLRLRAAVVCLGLAVVILLVYAQVTRFDFIYFDDNTYVLNNDMVKAGLSPGNLMRAFSYHERAYWHPLAWFSHMLDVEMYGMNPGLHHLTSVIIHILNSISVLLLLVYTTGAFWRCVLVAMLFALHPINVDSVAWIAERKNLISTFFWLQTMVLYVAYTRKPGTGRYGSMCLVFALGLLAKPMLVTLPFVLFMMDAWPLRRLHLIGPAGPAPATGAPPAQQIISLRQAVMEKIPLLLMSIAAIKISSRALIRQDIIVSFDLIPLSLRIENAIVSYAAYLGKMLWPSKLAIYYPFPAHVPMMQTLAAAILIVAITVVCLRYAHRRPWRLFGWLWFLGTLVPVSGIVQGGLWPAMADRWAYVPFIGIFLAAAWDLAEFCNNKPARFRNCVVAGTAVVLLLLAGVSHRQTAYWQNTLTLFQHTLETTGDNPFAHIIIAKLKFDEGEFEEARKNYEQAEMILDADPSFLLDYGILLEKLGDDAKATQLYQRALEKAPMNKWAHFYQANLQKKMGRNREAETHYRESLRIDPAFADAHNNLGTLLLEEGKALEGINHLHQALSFSPDAAAAAFNIGNRLLNTGKPKESIAFFKSAVKMSPLQPAYHINLGYALVQTGAPDLAARHFEKAMALDPTNTEVRRNLDKARQVVAYRDRRLAELQQRLDNKDGDRASLLTDIGDLYRDIGNAGKAVSYYEAALSQSPGYMGALTALATIHASTGNVSEAIRYFHKIVDLHPDSDKACYNLACLYAMENQPDAALQWLERALSLGYDNWALIYSDKDLARARQHPMFESLMRKYRR